MNSELVSVLFPLALLVFVIVFLVTRRSRIRGRVGPGAVGAVYDLLNEDKRNAVELIVEQRAEEIRPEYADGNLPDLAKPRPPDKPPR